MRDIYKEILYSDIIRTVYYSSFFWYCLKKRQNNGKESIIFLLLPFSNEMRPAVNSSYQAIFLWRISAGALKCTLVADQYDTD